MPTLLRKRGYRFHFYSNEETEPPHVHVRREDDNCKFWLEPVSLAYNDAMTSRQLKEVERIVIEHRDEFLKAWHEYFSP